MFMGGEEGSGQGESVVLPLRPQKWWVCRCSSEEGCEPQGTLGLAHRGMHMRTHTHAGQ